MSKGGGKKPLYKKSILSTIKISSCTPYIFDAHQYLQVAETVICEVVKKLKPLSLTQGGNTSKTEKTKAHFMNQKSLQINVFAEGTTGRIDIVGAISEWNQNNAIDLRARCLELKNSGVGGAMVYLMTVGGDCFQANEIVNILEEVFGTYTAKGGAIVASAGTYIAVRATSFEMAQNGQFMIHKPMGGVFGNETEMENYLQLLKNMTVTYYGDYVKKLKKPEQEFKDKWNAGDFWMTAKDAVEWGFATSVKEPVKIDAQTKALLQAMGKLNTNNNQNADSMDLKVMAVTLGLPETATEAEINAKIAANARKAADYDNLKAQSEQREKEEKTAKIKAELDKAEREKRIKADARANWQGMFEKDFEGTKALLDSLQAVVKPLSAEIKTSADGSGSTYQGKTFEQLQDENPDLLAELQDTNEEAYNALFADWKKRNKIK